MSRSVKKGPFIQPKLLERVEKLNATRGSAARDGPTDPSLYFPGALN